MKKLCITLPFVLLSATLSVGDEIDFNRDIRPILSDKCYFCHGPDEENNDSGLRLDSRAAAAEVIDSGELLKRITSDDPDAVMPPPHAKLTLSDDDIRTVKIWIQQGAVYKGHWAFALLPESTEPPTADPQWCRQTLDQFVRAKQTLEGVQPNPEAVPLRWLRRVTLDLTGLPPTIEDVNSFEQSLGISQRDAQVIDADARERAYAAVVDRLLNSKAYGEHMAVAWLDAARYADSYGYQSDKLNTQWPYRDWVVKAFNDNLSYDKFLTWQLAGDLLDTPTEEQKLATAFNRIHRLNNEGGAVFEEWRIENVADRVHTFGTAVLGLTMECCRCHDHKYDPIPMRDYYSLSAFFNSIDESGVYDRTQKVPCPSILLPTPAQQQTLVDAQKDLAAAEQRYRTAIDSVDQRWQQWKQSAKDGYVVSDLRLALGFDRKFDNTLKQIYHPSQSDRSWTSMPELVEVKDSAVARLAMDLASDKPADSAPNTLRLAMQLDGERGITTTGIEPFDRWTPFTVVVSMRETLRVADRSLIAHHTRGTDCGYNGWDLTIADGYLESRMYRVWPGNAIGIRTADPIPVDQWHQVAASYDGSSTAAGLQLFLNGKRLETVVLRDEVKKSCNVKVDHGGEFVVGQRFRARGLAHGLIDDVRVYTRDLTPPELGHLATAGESQPTLEYYTSAIDERARTAMAALTAARKAVVMAEEVMNEIPVMRETEQVRPAHVLARGQYDAPTSDKTRVARNTLSGLPLPFPKDAPQDRLGLAQWVTHPNHPLTARVAVNRMWLNFFAQSLVKTPENFGSQGDLPTHPAMLDWLARDFISSGWDVKRFCRHVVLSATYRQDSSTSPKQLEADPTNRLLARGPAYRLAAEQIRDLALSASGLLNSDRGGPPVSPYQPGGDLWRESNGMSPAFQQSVGKSLYRRSLYSVWKRTAPLPNMMAFDSTSREVCSVKRSRTNTPLQALVLLNDVQFVEACRKLAEIAVLRETDADRVNRAFVALTGRQPDGIERKTLVKLLGEERVWFTDHPADASKLLALGDAKPNSKAGDASLAAMTTVCQAILNLDATIWKR